MVQRASGRTYTNFLLTVIAFLLGALLMQPRGQAPVLFSPAQAQDASAGKFTGYAVFSDSDSSRWQGWKEAVVEGGMVPLQIAVVPQGGDGYRIFYLFGKTK